MEAGKPRTNPNNAQAHRSLPWHQEEVDKKTAPHAAITTLEFGAFPRQRAETHEQIQDTAREVLSQVLLPPQPRHLRCPHQTADLPGPVKEPSQKGRRQVAVPPQAPRVPRAPVPMLLRVRNRHLLAAGPASDVMSERQGLHLGLPHAGRRQEAAPPAGRYLCPR